MTVVTPPGEVQYYWEDLAEGSERDLGAVVVSEAEILAFARQFDPQPFHQDPEAARQSVFGGLCASGWHTCALCMRLTVDNFLSRAASLGSPGIENLRWKKPVFPGDTLHLRHRTLASRPLRSRPDVGMVRTAWTVRNQHGEVVMEMEGLGMFRRRHPADASEL